MDSLIAANIKQRPLRTLISVVGVSLGVILVVLFVGLARGMMSDGSRRQSNVDAELRFMSGGDVSFVSNPLMLPQGYADAILHGVQPSADNPEVEPKPPVRGVKATTPVGEWLKTGTGSIGFELIDGIDYKSFVQTTRLQITEGRGLSDGSDPATAYEAIVDRYFAETNTAADGNPIKIGSKINELGQDFTVVGIYEPSLLARVKIPLKTLQQLLGGAENCTFVMVKCERPELADQVTEEIRKYYPGHNVFHTDQIPALYSQSFGAVRVFLNVVIVFATVISALVILLAMYTTIIERTREIGILKSLGASKTFIVGIIEQEAAVISALGVFFGFAVAVPVKFWIEAHSRLQIEFEPGLILLAVSIGMLSGIIGALYPAIRAARLDAVEAISYE
jgi:putative ABC transport system permease protein